MIVREFPNEHLTSFAGSVATCNPPIDCETA
jgi:hypothetical protein